MVVERSVLTEINEDVMFITVTVEKQTARIWAVTRSSPGRGNIWGDWGRNYREETSGRNVRIPVQDYKSLRIVAMICGSLVNASIFVYWFNFQLIEHS